VHRHLKCRQPGELLEVCARHDGAAVGEVHQRLADEGAALRAEEPFADIASLGMAVRSRRL
jgi:hypothetical protein